MVGLVKPVGNIESDFTWICWFIYARGKGGRVHWASQKEYILLVSSFLVDELGV